MSSAIVVGIIIWALSFAIRVALIWRHRHRGCDAYYYLLSSEVFREKRRIPIVLPEVYALEEREQWYPPGFSVFLSLLPRRLLERYYWIISPTIDSFIAAVLAVMVAVMSGYNYMGFAAGLFYSLNSASMVDCTSLNSRPLGALLFTATMLCIMGTVLGTYWLLAFVVIFGFMLLMTHKLSSQLLYFLMPFMALVMWEWKYAMVLAVIIAASYMLSKGFLSKVWRGQYDIMSFWRRYWKELGAHQIYGSSMYPSPVNHDRGRVHVKGLRGLARSVSYLGMNAFILVVLWPAAHYRDLSEFDMLMLWWVVGTYLLAVLTQMVPAFRFAGEGYRYLKLAAFPVCYLAAIPFLYGYLWQPTVIYFLLVLAALLVSLFLIWKLFGFMSSSTATTIPFMDTGLGDMIERLKASGVSRILCVPESVADAVGYYCRKPVLRGTHNVPFQRVIPFFPTHKLPLDYLIKGYGVSHVVLMTSYVDAGVLGLNAEDRVMAVGEYELYEVGK